MPLQDVKRIGLDSKIPNIVNTDASPLLSENEEIEGSSERSDLNQNDSKKTSTEPHVLKGDSYARRSESHQRDEGALYRY